MLCQYNKHVNPLSLRLSVFFIKYIVLNLKICTEPISLRTLNFQLQSWSSNCTCVPPQNMLECPVCTERYDRQQYYPKMLPCMHTLCATCILRLVRVSSKPTITNFLYPNLCMLGATFAVSDSNAIVIECNSNSFHWQVPANTILATASLHHYDTAFCFATSRCSIVFAHSVVSCGELQYLWKNCWLILPNTAATAKHCPSCTFPYRFRFTCSFSAVWRYALRSLFTVDLITLNQQWESRVLQRCIYFTAAVALVYRGCG